MSNRDLIQTAKALAGREVARAIGVTISLTHDLAATNLAAKLIDEGTDELTEGGSLHEIRTVTFLVPLQTGFARPSGEAEPVSLGDKVVFLQRDYFVQDIQKDSTNALYTLRCSQRKRLSSGIN